MDDIRGSYGPTDNPISAPDCVLNKTDKPKRREMEFRERQGRIQKNIVDGALFLLLGGARFSKMVLKL